MGALLNSVVVPHVAAKFSHFERVGAGPMFYTDHKYGGLLYYVPAVTISAIYDVIFHLRNCLDKI